MVRPPLLLALLAFPALAQTPAAAPSPESPPTDVVRLTPEEREAAIEQGAARAARDAELSGTSDRKIQGQIGVESEFGEGSRFWFTLPLSRRALPPAAKRQRG